MLSFYTFANMKMIHRWKMLLALIMGGPVCATAQQYQYTADLAGSTDDQVKVTLKVPPFPSGKATFVMPRMVPGTYEVYDFGRFISGFEARDAAGATLPVEHPDDNTWIITGADKLAQLSYRVDDTWDWTGKGEWVFQPGGSNIEAGENFFVNNHCFFGYFEGRKDEVFEVTFVKPAGFYGATALTNVNRTASAEVFRANGYFDLIDSPIMFNLPDTATVQIGGATVMFAIYSPNHVITAAEVREEIKPVLEAQAAYLGGTLPVDRYAFIMYMFDGFAFSYGALEHNLCSMYYLPEQTKEEASQTLRDFSAHEFFHIVTPLNIHSEQIHDFDFMHPVMSRHLWLYEGVTEYSAGHVQVKQGLIGLNEYLEVVKEKMQGSAGYNDTVPFTTMSLGALDKYKDEYGNVYQKGALIGLCLDIQLRHYSKGEYGIQNLMKDLARDYGKAKPFEDAALFAKIEQLTYPEIGAFLRRYVGGPEPLPMKEILAMAGIEYAEVKEVKQVSLGGADFDANGNGEVFVDDVSELDVFGKDIGYKVGDVLVDLNGEAIDEESFFQVFLGYFLTHTEGDPFTLTVMRKGKKMKGKGKRKVLEAVWVKVDATEENYLAPVENMSPEQEKTLKTWLRPDILE